MAEQSAVRYTRRLAKVVGRQTVSLGRALVGFQLLVPGRWRERALMRHWMSTPQDNRTGRIVKIKRNGQREPQF
jgi:hypothetical protein